MLVNIVCGLIGLIFGVALGYLYLKSGIAKSFVPKAENDTLLAEKNGLEVELAKRKTEKDIEIGYVSRQLYEQVFNSTNAIEANYQAEKKKLEILSQTTITKEEVTNKYVSKDAYEQKVNDLKIANNEIEKKDVQILSLNNQLITIKSREENLNEKFETQKKDIEKLNEKFSTEFENIANKILDTKSEKFTELNKTNLKTILEPLGKNIDEFKTKVNEVYMAESKERFSLGEKVKELALLNQVISEEARNLTKALKGEAKTQGRWGEMILESILEKSGLVKGREYFMEYELMDSEGKPLRSDSEGRKMRPDAVIKYPDNRNVIIDSKVSLNAFTRLLESTDVEEQKKELEAHVTAIKNHIIALSAKGYDDYDKALDFVMMFLPSEPAYIAALQGDPDLWNFAYDKRILLLSPTNLITSLKLIVDLWKREYQNRNTMEIAERGTKLYEKFVGFISNLEDVGVHIGKAQGKYDEAFKQLSTGNDNLVAQATKLKNLGLKIKKDKELPQEIVKIAMGDEPTE